MGEWRVNNAITLVNVELEPNTEVYEKAGDSSSIKMTEKRDSVMYESWDIQIKDIKVLYNYHSYKSLLIQQENLNFRVIDKFTFGLQF